MVGVNMRIEHVTDSPSALRRQTQVHVRFYRGVYDGRFGFRTQDVGKASFAGAPHLQHRRVLQFRLRRIPGKTPRLHSTRERKRVQPTLMKPLGRDLADLSGIADSHHGAILGKIYIQRLRVTTLQRVVSVHVDASRNEPLCSVFRGADIQDSYGPVFREPLLQSFDIDLLHGYAPWWAGVPIARLYYIVFN